jgi:hypothetical protein
MKTRSSLRKANWSETREGHYLESCNQILFDRRMQLVIGEVEVFLLSGEQQTFLLEINKPKRMWYEIWLKLKDI